MNRILFMIIAAVALSGCMGKTRLINEHGAYKEYLATQKEMDNNWAEAVKSIADSADKCEDDICRVARGGQAMAALMSRPGGANASVQPFRSEPTTGEKVLLSLTGQAGSILGTAVNGYVAVEQSKNQTAVAINDSDNRAAISTSGFNALTETARAGLARATNEYNVGGNLGNTYGNDFTGGNRTDIEVGPGGVNGNDNQTANGENNFNPNQIAGNDLSGGAGGNCSGGAGAAGAAGAAGGAGGTGATGTGTGTSGGAGGAGGLGGSGGAGGNGGNCSGGSGGAIVPATPAAPAPAPIPLRK